MTMRANILFGDEYDEGGGDVLNDASSSSYRKAVAAAGLENDIKILPKGDLTETGERGVNMSGMYAAYRFCFHFLIVSILCPSGGQRARIALARAILASNRSDIYLLDDPFAAVDGATGEHMFSKGVVEALQGKLRIIVMNSHMELLKHFDKVLMLDGGRVVAYDTPENLLDSPTMREAFLAMTGLAVDEKLVNDLMPEEEESGENLRDQLVPSTSKNRLSYLRLQSLRSLRDVTHAESGKVKPVVPEKNIAVTQGEVDVNVGNLSSAVYIKYFGSCLWGQGTIEVKTIEDASPALAKDPRRWHTMDCTDYCQGSVVIGLAFLIFFAAQIMRVVCDLSLITWAQDSSGSKKNWYDFYQYLVTLGLLLFLNMLRMVYLNLVVTTGSNHIHQRVLHSVMAAPIPSFFDTHAIGEVEYCFILSYNIYTLICHAFA